MWATIKQCQTVVYYPLNLAQGFKMYFYSQGIGDCLMSDHTGFQLVSMFSFSGSNQ